MTSLDRQLAVFFVVVLNVEAFTLIVLTTYPSPKSQFCLKRELSVKVDLGEG